MEGSTTDVGLDTSKKSIQVAMLLPGRREPVEWELANEPRGREATGEAAFARGGWRAAGLLRGGTVRLHAAAPASSGRTWTRSWWRHRWFRSSPVSGSRRTAATRGSSRRLLRADGTDRGASADARRGGGARSVPLPRGCARGSAARAASTRQDAASPGLVHAGRRGPRRTGDGFAA